VVRVLLLHLYGRPVDYTAGVVLRMQIVHSDSGIQRTTPSLIQP